MAEAVRMVAPYQLEIKEMQLTEKPKNGEILLRVKAGGICGSDIHIYDGSHPIGDYPKIIGHEFAGEIEQIGPGVSGLHVGDRVVVDPIISCGECYSCKILNRPNTCSNLKVRGVHVDGGFATHTIVPAAAVHPVGNLPWRVATMVEPFTVAAQVIDRSRLSKDDTVLINGSGTIGLCCLVLAKLKGARVICTDISSISLEKAQEMGADSVINPRNEDILEGVKSLTGGHGVSVLIESVGRSDMLQNVLPCADRGARIVLIGFDKANIEVNPFDITFNEWEFIGSRLNTYKFDAVIKLFQEGVICPEALQSHHFSYHEAKEVFARILKKPDEFLKVILEF